MGQPLGVRLWGSCHRGFLIPGWSFLCTITSSVCSALTLGDTSRYWEWGWELDLCSVQKPQSVPLCVCWLPLPPPPIPEIAIFILPCLLSVTLTHQKHTKLISPKFLLVRDSVCVFLVISTFVKMYKVSLEKPEHRVVHLERLRTCTHTRTCAQNPCCGSQVAVIPQKAQGLKLRLKGFPALLLLEKKQRFAVTYAMVTISG